MPLERSGRVAGLLLEDEACAVIALLHRRLPGRVPFEVFAREVLAPELATVAIDAARLIEAAAAGWRPDEVPKVEPGSEGGTASPASWAPMTTSDAAAAIGVSTSRVRTLARAGQLAGIATCNGWLFDAADVDAYLEGRQ